MAIVYIQTVRSDSPCIRLGTSFPCFVDETNTNVLFNAHGASI